MKVYIGYDNRESEAYLLAKHTLQKTSGIIAEPLSIERLRSVGLYDRNVDARGGQYYDIPSQSPCSTEFATTRFLTPILCQSGFALFTDCDVVFLDDVRNMLNEIEPGKPVYVVKNFHEGAESVKMDNQTQTVYQSKNWSSVMLFDCDHPANYRLNIESINRLPGRALHRFYWLADEEIGELSPRWNWLVNVHPKPESVAIAHYTLGGPWIYGWEDTEHDHIWLDAWRDFCG